MQNFHVRDMENFIIEASIPLVTIVNYNKPPKIKEWLSQLSDEQVYNNITCVTFIFYVELEALDY